jgi:hypothetical protein
VKRGDSHLAGLPSPFREERWDDESEVEVEAVEATNHASVRVARPAACPRPSRSDAATRVLRSGTLQVEDLNSTIIMHFIFAH